MVRKSRKIQLTRRHAIVAILALIVLGVFLIWLFTPWLRKPEIIPVSENTNNTSPTSESQSAKSPDSNSKESSNDNPSSGSTAPTSSVNTTPPASPSGSFVSNHSPSLSNSPKEQSTCVTTPGASCYIQFTNGNQVKQLPVKQTDSSGAVVWDWDINTAGLSQGTWQIEAFANLNNQTRSTKSIPLEISP